MDPKQWAKDLPADVREVLDAGVAQGAPSGAKQAVWNALATKLPAATVGAAAGGLTVFSILKPLAVGLAIGALATVGVLEIRGTASSVPPSASVPRAIPVAAPPRASSFRPSPVNAPATVDPIAPSRSLKTAAAPSAARAASSAENAGTSPTSSVAAFPDQVAPREDATVLESRRLNQARAALQAGDGRGALAQIDALASAFPNGVLVQEREALRIEALLGLGQKLRARELARSFLERYPQSPHAAAVERALR